jgi:hypothetical protein
MDATDATIARLRWFFNDSSAECEIPFMLAALDIVDDAIPPEPFEVGAITKTRAMRSVLLGVESPHADVLQWMTEQRQWPARILTHFSWPGVAVRTEAARKALDADGQGSGDHCSRGGVVGFLAGLPTESPVLRAVQKET